MMTKCKKHPTYKGIIKPRVNCADCREVYAFTQKNKLRSFFYHFNKPASAAAGKPIISVHFNGKCYMVTKLTCMVATKSKTNDRSPRFVMVGQCRLSNFKFNSKEESIVISGDYE